MNRPPLFVRRLRVDRLYGFPHDGLAADDLAPGINVVYGVNGRGKTTFGKAVHALVWPETMKDHGPILSGRLTIDGEEWRVDLEAGAVRHRRGDVDAPPPPLPAPDHHARYVLSLHELVGSDGRSFAETIRRDAAGGMDVDRAAADLKFTHAAVKSGGPTRTAEAAWERVVDVRGKQHTLRGEADRLVGLRADLHEADAARERADLYDRAAEYAEARDAARDARAALDALPDVLARVRPDDADVLRGLRERLDDARARAERAAEDADAARTRRAEGAVARAGRPASPVAELEAHLHDLQNEADRRARCAEETARSRAAAGDAWREVGGVVDAERASRIDAVDAAAFDAFADRAARHAGRAAVDDALRRAAADLRDAAPDTPRDVLADAAALLRAWLRDARDGDDAGERDAPAGARTAAAASAAAALVGGAVAGVLWHPAAALLALAALPLAWLAHRLRPAQSPSPGADLPGRFAALPVAPPEAWTREAVEARLREIERTAAAADAADAARRQYEARRTDPETAERLRHEVEEGRRRLVDALGITVEDAPGGDVTLAFLARAVQQARRAVRASAAAEAAEDAAARQVAHRLDAVAALLAPFDLPAPEDAAALSDRIAALRAAYEADAEAARAVEAAERDLRDARSETDDAAATVQTLYERLGLDPDDDGDDAVGRACADHAEYRRRADAAKEADARADAARGRLERHAAFEADHLDLTPDAAAAHRRAARVRAARRDEIADEISRIEERVAQAQRGRALEEAVAEHRDALDRLREERDRAAALRIGGLAADHAARTAREEQLPPVLQRARDLFGAITHDRFRLTFDPVRDRFGAVDVVHDRAFDLKELSSGTRVQLLLSIRVAFVEQQELGVRLPLVLDEVLANSDEARARAITEAVLHLCREGRQVFYFTAQPDEVAKWRALAAANPDVPCCFVELDGRRPADARLSDALPDPGFGAPVPAPEGRTHAAYGALLGVSAWDGRRPVAALPLWYAVDDPEALHRALRAGLDRLGPFRAARARGALAAYGLDDALADRIDALAEALDAWRTAWRLGRGRPVDRAALEHSGAVSETFIDRVAAYTTSLGRDARALVDGLRAGNVKGFWTKQTDDLEAYLQDHGYLDPAEPLDASAVRARVAARVAPHVVAGRLSIDDVWAFLARVQAGPPEPATADA